MNCSKFVIALTTLNMHTLRDYLTADRHRRQHDVAFVSQNLKRFLVPKEEFLQLKSPVLSAWFCCQQNYLLQLQKILTFLIYSMSADVKEKHILLYYSFKMHTKVKVDNQPFQPVCGRKKAVNIPSII